MRSCPIQVGTALAAPFLLAFAVLLSAPAAAAQCPSWSAGYEAPGLQGDIFDTVLFDDGTGVHLYAGGNLSSSPGGATFGVARWNGQGWSPVGPWIGGTVGDLCTFDDGSGTKLYAAGQFPYASGSRGGIARWDGSAWSLYTTELPLDSFGSGFISLALAVEVYDSGSGPRLWVGGQFGNGTGTANVAQWTGSSWNFAGGGLNDHPFQPGEVQDLCVFDDGQGGGPALYAIGGFSNTGTGTWNGFNVARTYGTSWSGVGSVGGLANRPGIRLAVDDAGSTHTLVAASEGLNSGYSQLSRWNGTSWTNIGSEIAGHVRCMRSFDSSSGVTPGLWVGTQTPTPLRRWDGVSWNDESVGLPLTAVGTLDAFDGDGPGSRPFATGMGFAAARPNGSWHLVGGQGADARVDKLASYRAPGRAPELFASGDFTLLGGESVPRFARFDGTTWSRPFANVPANVRALEVFDDGAGTALFVAGALNPTLPGVTAVRRYDGNSWTELPSLPLTLDVRALTSWNDAGTRRTVAAGSRVWALAPTAWVDLLPQPFSIVTSLAAFDDGGGEALFLGGAFTDIGGVPCRGIGRLRNGVLDPIGAGVPPGTRVERLVVHDDGSGRALYACGSFPTMNGVACGGIARWNGTTWSSLGGGVSTNPVSISTMTVHDDGSGAGPRLVVAGPFSSIGGVSAANIAAWDGTNWAPLGLGTSIAMNGATNGASPTGLATFDAGDGRGPDLFVGGAFTRAGGQDSFGIARHASCGGAAQTFCHADGSGTLCPCGNDSAVGDRAGCRNSFGGGGALRVHGRASLSDDTLVLEGDVFPNAIGVYFQGTTMVAGGAGVVFGDGLRCTGGPFVRLGIRSSPTAQTAYPGPIGAPVSQQGMIASPGTRQYQFRYRDSVPFCTSDTFNYTNGVSVQWQP